MEKIKLTPEICDQLTKEGADLYLSWDGGNDSGSVSFDIIDKEGKSITDLYDYNDIVNECYDTLDYGSWAWDFEATGEAHWNVEEQAFIGEDRYAGRRDRGDEDEYECDIKITIPKSLWFASVAVNIQYERWESEERRVEFMIQHGFKSPEHEKTELELTDYLDKELDKIKDAVDLQYSDSDSVVENLWGEHTIPKELFTEEGDNLVFHIRHIGLDMRDVEHKEIRVEFIKTEQDEQV